MIKSLKIIENWKKIVRNYQTVKKIDQKSWDDDEKRTENRLTIWKKIAKNHRKFDKMSKKQGKFAKNYEKLLKNDMKYKENH